MDTAEYVRAPPHPALARYVLGYSGYREHSVAPVRRREAPTGACTLILSLGPLRLHGPAGPVRTASFLAGLHDAAVVTEFTGAARDPGRPDATPLGVFALLGRPMSELANRTPFRAQVGLAPKAAARVLRFRRAAGLLVPGPSGKPGRASARSISEVAAECGYADHARLVREFRALAGCTPSQYRAETP